jgi:Uma2 family endonuclease
MVSTVTVRLDQVMPLPGQITQVRNLTWQEFQQFLAERSDKSRVRIRYSHNTLSLMSPSLSHEFASRAIESFVKILLQIGKTPAIPCGSTTLLIDAYGVEPDCCFYIEHLSDIRSKLLTEADRIDLSIDPPPDLAIEIDKTSITTISDYIPIRVPEVWIYKPLQRQLAIYIFDNGTYQVASNSLQFPTLDVHTLLFDWIDQATQQDPVTLEQTFKQQVESLLSSPHQ